MLLYSLTIERWKRLMFFMMITASHLTFKWSFYKFTSFCSFSHLVLNVLSFITESITINVYILIIIIFCWCVLVKILIMELNDCMYLLSFLIQYLDEFVLSWYLSRRLAHFCAKRLAQLCNESGCLSPRTQSPLLTTNSNGYVINDDFILIFVVYNY